MEESGNDLRSRRFRAAGFTIVHVTGLFLGRRNHIRWIHSGSIFITIYSRSILLVHSWSIFVHSWSILLTHSQSILLIHSRSTLTHSRNLLLLLILILTIRSRTIQIQQITRSFRTVGLEENVHSNHRKQTLVVCRLVIRRRVPRVRQKSQFDRTAATSSRRPANGRMEQCIAQETLLQCAQCAGLQNNMPLLVPSHIGRELVVHEIRIEPRC